MDHRNWIIAAAQFVPDSGNCAANMKKMLDLTDRAADAGASLVLFPELALTGYYLKADVLRELAVPAEGSWSGPLREKAAERGIMIAAGYPERDPEGGKMYNSCLFTGKKGEILGNSRKRYLWGREKKIFAPGEDYPVVQTETGGIAILLCYDLEYPEPARIAALKGADLILCPAAWSRRAAGRWRIDTAANALFNLVYVAGANFTDENCCGLSRIVAPDGEVLSSAGEDEETVITAEIQRDRLEQCRRDIPYRRDIQPRILKEAALAGEKGFISVGSNLPLR